MAELPQLSQAILAKLQGLNPEFQAKVINILQQAIANQPSYKWTVSYGYRSPEEQDKLYAIGRRGIKGEKIVTNAKGGSSKHNYGKAVDVYPIYEGKIPNYEQAKAAYDYLGNLAKQNQLVWGGGFKIGDYGHIEY